MRPELIGRAIPDYFKTFATSLFEEIFLLIEQTLTTVEIHQVFEISEAP